MCTCTNIMPRDNILMSLRRSPCGLAANVLDCDIVLSEFELQYPFYIHFRTNALEKAWLWH